MIRALALSALAGASAFACLNVHNTDCAANDPLCPGEVGWWLYQQLVDPDIPLFQIAGDQGVILRSLDGDTWTTSVTANALTTQALFGGIATDRLGNWVATGNTGVVMISKDSADWRLATDSGAVAVLLRGVSYSAERNRWLSVGNGTNIRFSDDGDSWSSAGTPLGPTPYYNSAYGNGQFVGTGNSGGIYRSGDGNTWTAATSNGTPTGILWSVVYVAEQNQWILTGATGQIYRSTDGDTWTAAASSGALTAGDLRAVRFGNGQYVAVGASGVILRSTDGDTWTVANDSGLVATTLGAADYSPELGMWVAVGGNGIIIRSSDGNSWSLANSSGDVNVTLFGLAAGVIPVPNP